MKKIFSFSVIAILCYVTPLLIASFLLGACTKTCPNGTKMGANGVCYNPCGTGYEYDQNTGDCIPATMINNPPINTGNNGQSPWFNYQWELNTGIAISTKPQYYGVDSDGYPWYFFSICINGVWKIIFVRGQMAAEAIGLESGSTRKFIFSANGVLPNGNSCFLYIDRTMLYEDGRYGTPCGKTTIFPPKQKQNETAEETKTRIEQEKALYAEMQRLEQDRVHEVQKLVRVLNSYNKTMVLQYLRDTREALISSGQQIIEKPAMK